MTCSLFLESLIEASLYDIGAGKGCFAEGRAVNRPVYGLHQLLLDGRQSRQIWMYVRIG